MVVITFINWVVDNAQALYRAVPKELWPLIISTPFVSGFQIKLHKWLQVESAKYKQAITVLLAVAMALTPLALHWVHGSQQHLAALFGANLGIVFTVLTLVYRYVVKGTAANLSEFSDYRANKSVNTNPQIIAPVVQTVPSGDLLED